MTLENQTFLIDGLEINVSVPVYYPANYTIKGLNYPKIAKLLGRADLLGKNFQNRQLIRLFIFV